MPFNSVAFWLFFIITAVLFGFIKREYRWYLLLAASLVFFAWALPVGLVYIIATTLTTFFAALYVAKPDKTAKKRKAMLWAALVFNFGILFMLKYFNFFALGIANAAGGEFTAIKFLVPIGISFYTFQTMGYLMDVYNGIAEPQKNYLKLLLFTAYFPQLIDGPISRYNDIKDALYSPPDVEYERGKDALVLFAWGLFKKICVADSLIVYANLVYGNYSAYHGILIFSGAVAYALYIYADFSGCIDMARGISMYFGIDLKDNFRRPFFADSVEDFWRRWHITLSEWFRDYLFYPLLRTNAASKIGKHFRTKKKKKAAKIVPTVIALLIVWFTTGLWHGANMTYIVYGLYYGVFMIAGVIMANCLPKKKKEKSAFVKTLNVVLTFVLVCISFIIFNSESISAAFGMIANMFNVRHIFEPHQISTVVHSFISSLGGKMYFGIAMASTLFLILRDALLEFGVSLREYARKCPRWIKYIGSVVIVLFLLFMMNRTAGDFAYMKF